MFQSKMKKSTKIVLIILSVLSFISVVFIISGIKKSKKEGAPALTPPRPQIPTYIQGALPIEVKVKKEEFNFPEKLPFLSASPETVSKDTAQMIASVLGFQKPPDEFEDINEGFKYYWTNESSFLMVTPKTATIKYGLSSPTVPVVTDKHLSNEELIKLATTFLTDKKIIEKEKIKSSSITPYKENPLSEGLEKTDRESARVFQINFTYSLADYEILTIDPSIPLVFVQILPDGSVYNLEVILFKNAVAGPTEYSLRSYDEILANLSEAKLMSLQNDYINLSDLIASDIKNITVDKISLVYLLDSAKSQNLQPVYLLEGATEIINSTADRALLYLPAIK